MDVVDSADVWLVRALLTAGFRPRVMLVEYNYQFGATKLAFPDTSWMPHTKSGAQWSGSCSYGSSAAVILAAMRPFGYALVNAATGLDLVLVREDPTTYQTIPRLDESVLLAMHEGMDAAEYSLNSPMTREEAGNLLDFEIIANGGSICATRHAAAPFVPPAMQPPPRFVPWHHAAAGVLSMQRTCPTRYATRRVQSRSRRRRHPCSGRPPRCPPPLWVWRRRQSD